MKLTTRDFFILWAIITALAILECRGQGGLRNGAWVAVATKPASAALPDPVSWWKFNNNANDTMGVNNGTAVEEYTFSATTPKEGTHKLVFDNTFGRIALGTSDTLKSQTFTVCGWYLEASSTSLRMTFCNGWKDGAGALATNGVWIYKGTGHKLTISAGNASGREVAVGATTIDDGTWRHIAATYDNESLRVYVDGALDGGPSNCTRTLTFGTNVTIGRTWDTLFNGYTAQLDSWRYYNTALSAAQIQSIYDSEK